ncbi:MAG TPA: hypothetical protein VGZ22_08505 [Isosphaeraceae bacterium]|jgi:hypothetical protein|nr:hypothetical protein [Isosphaeraceae bacterium]
MRYSAAREVPNPTLAVGGLAVLAMVVGLHAGWAGAVLSVLLLALPVAGLLLGGHVSSRAIVAAGLALALGSALIHPAAGSVFLGDLMLLGGLAVTALVGGVLADRLVRPGHTPARGPIVG